MSCKNQSRRKPQEIFTNFCLLYQYLSCKCHNSLGSPAITTISIIFTEQITEFLYYAGAYWTPFSYPKNVINENF